MEQRTLKTRVEGVNERRRGEKKKKKEPERLRCTRSAHSGRRSNEDQLRARGGTRATPPTGLLLILISATPLPLSPCSPVCAPATASLARARRAPLQSHSVCSGRRAVGPLLVPATQAARFTSHAHSGTTAPPPPCSSENTGTPRKPGCRRSVIWEVHLILASPQGVRTM